MQGEVFDPVNEGFIMAIGLEEYTTKEAKSDPTFVKWFANYIVYENNKPIEQRMEPLYPCTAKDFKKFQKVEKNS